MQEVDGSALSLREEVVSTRVPETPAEGETGCPVCAGGPTPWECSRTRAAPASACPWGAVSRGLAGSCRHAGAAHSHVVTENLLPAGPSGAAVLPGAWSTGDAVSGCSGAQAKAWRAGSCFPAPEVIMTEGSFVPNWYKTLEEG